MAHRSCGAACSAVRIAARTAHRLLPIEQSNAPLRSWRDLGVPLSCAPNTDQEAFVCYEKCKPQYDGWTGVCTCVISAGRPALQSRAIACVRGNVGGGGGRLGIHLSVSIAKTPCVANHAQALVPGKHHFLRHLLRAQDIVLPQLCRGRLPGASASLPVPAAECHRARALCTS
jgi:hypothetical protein